MTEPIKPAPQRTRYFHHPESDCFFTTTDGSFPDDGCVVELTRDQYLARGVGREVWK